MANHIRPGTKVIFEGKESFETGTLDRYGGYSASGGSGPTLFRSFTSQVYVIPDGQKFPVGMPHSAVRKDTQENREKMAKRLATIRANQERIRRENRR